MKKSILLLSVFLISLLSFSQKDTVIHNEVMTIKYYSDMSGVMNLSTDELNSVKKSYNFRIGATSNLRLVGNLSSNLGIMGNFKGDTSCAIFVSTLYYEHQRLSFEFGYKVDAVADARPSPWSLDAAFEYIGQAEIPVNGIMLKTSLKLNNGWSLRSSVSEFGNSFSDSTRYAITISHKDFRLTGFLFDGVPGVVYGLRLGRLYTFGYVHREKFSGYNEFKISEEKKMTLALDWRYDFNDNELCFDENDYIEALILRSFSSAPIFGADVKGLYGLGISYSSDEGSQMKPLVNLYFGFKF